MENNVSENVGKGFFLFQTVVSIHRTLLPIPEHWQHCRIQKYRYMEGKFENSKSGPIQRNRPRLKKANISNKTP